MRCASLELFPVCSIPFSVAPIAERKLFNGSMEANLEGCLVVLFVERCILKILTLSFFITVSLCLSLSACVCVSLSLCICASAVPDLSVCFLEAFQRVERESSRLELTRLNPHQRKINFGAT